MSATHDFKVKNGLDVLNITQGYKLNGTTVLNYSGGNIELGDLGAGVNLHYSGSTKLATTSSGVTVTGGIAATTSISLNGSTMAFDSGNDYMEFNKSLFSPNGYFVGTTGTKVGQLQNASGVMNLEAASTRQISFANETNGEFVRINATGNVGIGKTNPLQPLNVHGRISSNLATTDHYYGAWLDGNSTAGQDSFLGLGPWHSNAGYVKFFQSSSPDRLAIYTSNTADHVTLQESGGNVGIGTTAPANKLHVKAGASGASSFDSRYNLTLEDDGENYIGIYSPSNSFGGVRFLNAANSIRGYIDYYHGSQGDKMQIYAQNQVEFNFPSTGITAVFKQDGKVGIGTTSPDTNVDITSSGVQGLILNEDPTNSSASSRIFLKSTQRTNTILNVSGNIEFRTGATIGSSSGTVRMTIVGSSGNVTIPGTLTVGTFSPTSIAITSGTVKLDGNHPSGTGNVALGDGAGGSLASGANRNVLIGKSAGAGITTGDYNTAVGYHALTTDDVGERGTAIGYFALANLNYNGLHYNTAVGFAAGEVMTTGIYNTLVGGLAGDAITTGVRNTALGAFALTSTITQSNNTAMGYNALTTNVNGGRNTAVGADALALMNPSSSGNSYNAAFGYAAGANMTTAVQNTLLGSRAGVEITTGNYNTAVGYNSLGLTTSGYANVAIGRESLYDLTTGTHNVSVGFASAENMTTGSQNVALGSYTLQAQTTRS